jgi:hypothetical protein
MLTTLHQQLQLLKQGQEAGGGLGATTSYLFPLGVGGGGDSAPRAAAPLARADAAPPPPPRRAATASSPAPPAPPLLSPEYQSLLQELIAALLGHFGDVFVDSGADAAASAARHSPGDPPSLAAGDDAGVVVSLPPGPGYSTTTTTTSMAPALWAYPTSAAASDPVALSRPPWEAARAVRVATGAAPWLAPRDRALLERLAALGAHCAALRAFVARESAADDAAADAEDDEEEDQEAEEEERRAAAASGATTLPAAAAGHPHQARRSAYRRALASGVAELLAVYEATVTGDAQLRAVLPPERGGRGAGGGLAAVQHALADAAVLLPQLHAFVWEEVDGRGGGGGGGGGVGGHDDDDGAGQTDDAGPSTSRPPLPAPLRGAALLRALHRRAHCGHPLLEACFGRLYWHAHQALLAQLAAWVAHGELLERGGGDGGEFFVQAGAGGGDGDIRRAPRTREEEEAASYRDWHEGVSAVGEEAAAAGGGEGSAAAALAVSAADEDNSGLFSSSSGAFDLLPPGVTPQLAASAAFVGRAVRLLRSAPAARMARERQEQEQQRRLGAGDNGRTTPATTTPSDTNDDDDCDASSSSPQLMPTSATRAYAAAVASVAGRSSPAGGTALLPAAPSSSSTSQAAALARAVQLARADAARRLWRVLLRDADVLGHLRAVRAYALLGRGDLFSAFLEEFFERAQAAAAAAPAAPAPAAAARAGSSGAGRSSSLAALEAETRRAWLSAAARCGASSDPRFALFWPRLVPAAAGAGASSSSSSSPQWLFSAALAGPRAAEAARRAAAGLHPPSLSSSSSGGGAQEAAAAAPPSSSSSSSSGASAAARRWGDALCVSFRPPWPLGLLLTPSHLARYSALGRALLRLRRVQAALDTAWADLGRLSAEARRVEAQRRLGAWQRQRQQQQRGGGGGGDAMEEDEGEDNNAASEDPSLRAQLSALATAARLRQHMAHLAGNLAVYLQQDVIGGRFSELLARVEQAADFAEAQVAHDRCVRELVTQSLLPHASLSRQFGEVFSQALALADIVAAPGRRVAGVAAGAAGASAAAAASSSSSRQQPWWWVDAEAVRAVSDAFQATTAGLYVALQSRSLQQHDRAPHLRQLQLRLDFNGFIGRRRLALLAGAKEARLAMMAAQAQQQAQQQQQQQVQQ